jgi:hypothetical protein
VPKLFDLQIGAKAFLICKLVPKLFDLHIGAKAFDLYFTKKEASPMKEDAS